MPEPIRMEADVKIRRNDDGLVSVLVNGEEMNLQILGDSLEVTFPFEQSSRGKCLVTFSLFADLDLDLPAEVEVR